MPSTSLPLPQKKQQILKNKQQWSKKYKKQPEANLTLPLSISYSASLDLSRLSQDLMSPFVSHISLLAWRTDLFLSLK